jgi:hypothetical protein
VPVLLCDARMRSADGGMGDEDAANDAHCARMVHDTLGRLAKQRGVSLEPDRYGIDLKKAYDARRAKARATDAAAAAAADCPTASADAGSTVPGRSAAPGAAPARKGAPANPFEGWDPGPRQRRAYELWHARSMDARAVGEALRPGQALKASTVMCVIPPSLLLSNRFSRFNRVCACADGWLCCPGRSYVVGALQADPGLPYDRERLWALVQEEAGSWARHKEWLLKVDLQ